MSQVRLDRHNARQTFVEDRKARSKMTMYMKAHRPSVYEERKAKAAKMLSAMQRS